MAHMSRGWKFTIVIQASVPIWQGFHAVSYTVKVLDAEVGAALPGRESSCSQQSYRRESRATSSVVPPSHTWIHLLLPVRKPKHHPWSHPGSTAALRTNTRPLAHVQTTGNCLHENKKIPGALPLPNPSVEAMWHVNTVSVTGNGMELHGRPSLVLSCFSQGFWSHWLQWAWAWRSTWGYQHDL